MGKLRLKFDPTNFFLEAQHDEQGKAKFLKSEVFPVAVAVYNCTDGKLRVGAVEYYAKSEYEWSNQVKRVNFVTPTGLGVANLTVEYDTYRFGIYNSDFRGSWDAANVVLSTKKIKYLMAKLSKNSNHDAAKWLKIRTQEADLSKSVAEVLQKMVDSVIDKFRGNSHGAPVVNLDGNLRNVLSAFFAGEISKSDLDMNTLNEFDTCYKEYLQKREKFRDSLVKAKEFFSEDKWFVVDGVNSGVIVGAVSGAQLTKAIDIFCTTESLPPPNTASNYLNEIVPLTWYKSMNDLPEQMKSDIDMSLLMVKSHLGKDLFETGNGFGDSGIHTDIGAYTYQLYNTARFALFHK